MTLTPDEIRSFGAIDLMLSVPTGDPRRWYDFLRKQLLDRESREDFEWATAEVETQASKPADPDEGGPLRCPVLHASPQRSTRAPAPRS